MTFTRLLLRNLLFHWRGNLAVLLGVAVGTAVLTGALLVGDSLRGSLRERALDQLGWVEHALVGGRFFREELAASPEKLGVTQAYPVVLLQGSASSAGSQTVDRVPRVTILGISGPKFGQLGQNAVVLNAALAGDLGVGAGDSIVLHLPKASLVPRESLLGRRTAGDVLDDWQVTVHAVLGGGPMSQFTLTPTPAAPRNVFVPLHALQAKIDQQGRANGLLVAGAESRMAQEQGRPVTEAEIKAGKVEDWLQRHLHSQLTLDDWGLVLHDPDSRTRDLFAQLDHEHDGRLTHNEYHWRVARNFIREADQDHDGVLTRDEVRAFYRRHRNYLSLESRQMLLEPAVGDAARQAASDLRLLAAPTLVYFANSITAGKDSIPYSVVAALDPNLPPPLGPFLPPSVKQLKDNEIVLAGWDQSPLHAKPGDAVSLTYFEPEEGDQPREKTATFTLAGFVPMRGAAADPDLSPAFPGITDKLDIRDWDPPFPYHNERITPRDERYWDEYRTTPKAYVTLAAGQNLWASRFGNLTSVRVAPPAAPRSRGTDDMTPAAEAFRTRLLEHLQPEKGGFVFDPVRRRALEASAGGVPFTGLFLGFSCFLIAAALLLVGLLFRLNLDRRAAEVGVLLATGYRRGTLRRLLLGEGLVLAAVGALVGLAGAIGYAWLLLDFLRLRWLGGLDQSFLRLHLRENGGASFLIGYAGALVVSLLTIAWAVRVLGRVSPRALLSGETADAEGRGPVRPFWSVWIAAVGAAGGVACIVAGRWVQDVDMKAGTFFGGGSLLLIAGLAAAWAWMRWPQKGHVGGHGGIALGQLGVRNASRHPVRSLLTAGLLASAAFLIVAVESFHRDPTQDFFDQNGGSGGFTLLAQTDVPVYQDLATPKGRDQLAFPDADSAALRDIPIASFRVRAGDDASCLNLYQPRRPRLFGAPHALIERGGFRFADWSHDLLHDSDNPWQLLEQPLPDGAIPVFGESSAVQYMLNSGLGKDYQVPDENGRPVTLRFVGLLQDSVFQSELLMSEKNFLRLYPRQEGYQFFLVGAPPDRLPKVRQVLERNLADQGVAVESTKRRLEGFLAMQNTYLATFQALGGLGLLLGALGLAVVLLRSVWERRGELALLRALGFRERALGWLVLAENGFLLVLGLAVGAVTALLAVAPHVLAGAGEVPWLRLVGLLGLVLLVGLTSAALAMAATLRAPLLPALRRE
jgi:ABC-type lipoprotein release transport system permease subunit